jgi:hypothetical protein
MRLRASASWCAFFYYCGCKLVGRGRGVTTAVYVVSGQAVTTAVYVTRKNTSGYHRCVLGKLDKL